MPEPTSIAEVAAPPGRGRPAWMRIAVVGCIALLGFGLGQCTGLSEQLDLETVRAWMQQAGALGFLAFLALFVLAGFVQVPGSFFVLAASLAYGPVVGFFAGYLGAMLNCLASFEVSRRLGGQPLASVSSSWVRRVLRGIDAHPIRTVTVLRLLLWLAPSMSIVLSMTSLRRRDFLLGTALGLAGPILVAVTFVDRLVGWMS